MSEKRTLTTDFVSKLESIGLNVIPSSSSTLNVSMETVPETQVSGKLFDIKELKEAATPICHIVGRLHKKSALITYTVELPAIITGIIGAGEIANELLDIDEAEIIEFKDHVKNELDLGDEVEDESTESFVEEICYHLLGLFFSYQKFMKNKAA